MLLGNTDGLTKAESRGRPSMVPHQDIEQYLGRYAGLMLYLKEMDEKVYAKLCAVCFFHTLDLNCRRNLTCKIRHIFLLPARFTILKSRLFYLLTSTLFEKQLKKIKTRVRDLV
jgi:hypothetical protein